MVAKMWSCSSPPQPVGTETAAVMFRLTQVYGFNGGGVGIIFGSRQIYFALNFVFGAVCSKDTRRMELGDMIAENEKIIGQNAHKWSNLKKGRNQTRLKFVFFFAAVLCQQILYANKLLSPLSDPVVRAAVVSCGESTARPCLQNVV